MKTKVELQKEPATESARLWSLRNEIMALNTTAACLVAEIVGDASDTVDNRAELLNQL